MPADVLNLSLPTIGSVSIGATAREGQVRIAVTALLGNGSCSVDPATIRSFIAVLDAAATAAEGQRLATQDRAR
jgi:hypothetical protein